MSVVATLHVVRPQQPIRSGAFTVTAHAAERMSRRGIRPSEVAAVLRHGRATYPDGRAACYYAVGRREVARAARQGCDLRALEGLTVVVCSTTRAVRTVYRNHDFSGHARRSRRAYAPRPRRERAPHEAQR